MENQFMVGYEVRTTPRGKRYAFFCQLTGEEVCQTEPITEQNPQLALALAKKSARPYFNRCQKCGRWICDKAYNIDEMMCVECAPL